VCPLLLLLSELELLLELLDPLLLPESLDELLLELWLLRLDALERDLLEPFGLLLLEFLLDLLGLVDALEKSLLELPAAQLSMS